MPARMLLDSKDIASLGFSLRAAQYLLAMFEKNNHIIHNGKKKLIDVRYFAKYLADQDGSDPSEKRQDILEIIRQKDRETSKCN